MVNVIRGSWVGFSALKKDYILKSIAEMFSGTLAIAVVMRVFYQHFSPELILTVDYLKVLPSVLILVPFIMALIKNNPLACYRLKGVLSVGGLFLLLLTEAFGWDKHIYLLDAALVSFAAMLTIPHRNYYHSYIVDKDKELSELLGYVDVCNKLVYVVAGLSIVFSSIPLYWLLTVWLGVEMFERVKENKCASVVFS